MNRLIGIPTFKRAGSLTKLLDSLVANLPREGYEIVVIDNDPRKSAQAIVSSYKSQLEISYDVEPEPGVVHVRNRILDRAQSYDAVIFLDDDEWVSPSWATALEQAAQRYPSAILAGPVRYILPPSAPNFIKTGGFFKRREHEDGQTIKVTGTGNSFIPRAVLETIGNDGFDARFSRIGGEDTELFRRLVKNNIQIRWVAQAIVFESVPESGITLQSISRRYRRTGLVNGVLDSAEKNLGHRIVLTASRIIVGACKYYGRRLTSLPVRAKDMTTLYSGLGHLDAIVNRDSDYYGNAE